MKKIYVKTMGCQMNVYDSEKMIDLMALHGYEQTDIPEEADLLLVNTCHIRAKATDKVFSILGVFREIKEKREAKGLETFIGVIGCVVQAQGEELFRKVPFVNVILGPQNYHRLPELLALSMRKKESQAEVFFPKETKFDFLAPAKAHSSRAFLAIQEGCDKFCSYCVVPYTRGAEYSRPMDEILKEAKQFIETGAKEITLLGQNVNAWHGEDLAGKESDLGELIYRLAEIDGIKRLFYVTSYPTQMTEKLILAHKEVDILMPYLHLPAQSGSNSVLKAMNRRYTVEEYKEVISKLKEARPDMAFSSDFIVGFPGETDADFEATYNLVKEVEYAHSFSFKYSRRPGTPASILKNQVPEKVKAERLMRLQELILTLQKKAHEKEIGRTQEILVLNKGKRKNQISGYNEYLQNVHFEGQEELIGKIVSVKIEKATQNSLLGSLVK
ncbi:MAG: tRNA (N6-isopentenyl adenosine(37)-C2)-methylthiotransferase MiaB [Alphaproteobacteria bacterium]|nr:tRNA (N6-isopentenyl adenosine(37)-C2)-methylthiotransferase MiaB [Alphaproteobacteria bacterium]